MHKIVYKKVLSSDMFWLEFEAPYVAAKAKPGQFIIFRVDEFGERVPLTIAGVDKEKSTVTIIFQAEDEAHHFFHSLRKESRFST